jgi:DNA-binding CsgD family transcriptional regulator
VTPYLTLRQDQILRLVAEGNTTQEIAARLGISAATVERHVEDVRAALGARNRSHAVWLAVTVGFLRPEAAL